MSHKPNHHASAPSPLAPLACALLRLGDAARERRQREARDQAEPVAAAPAARADDLAEPTAQQRRRARSRDGESTAEGGT